MKFNLSEEVAKRQEVVDPLFEINSKGELRLTEPIFILRAQDRTAPQLIALWIALNQKAPKEKLESAQEILNTFIAWPRKKDPD